MNKNEITLLTKHNAYTSIPVNSLRYLDIALKALKRILIEYVKLKNKYS